MLQKQKAQLYPPPHPTPRNDRRLNTTIKWISTIWPQQWYKTQLSEYYKVAHNKASPCWCSELIVLNKHFKQHPLFMWRLKNYLSGIWKKERIWISKHGRIFHLLSQHWFSTSFYLCVTILLFQMDLSRNYFKTRKVSSSPVQICIASPQGNAMNGFRCAQWHVPVFAQRNRTNQVTLSSSLNSLQ